MSTTQYVMDTEGVRRLRILDPIGQPEIIECDGVEYKQRLVCDMISSGYGLDDSYKHTCGECGSSYYSHQVHPWPFCMYCGAEVRPSKYGGGWKKPEGKKLYVIGAVTGIDDDNRPAFEEVRYKLIAAGYQAEIPHDTIPEGTDWQEAMKQSISRLLKADGVATLPDRTFSKGASIEYGLACDLRIPIGFYKRWIERAEEEKLKSEKEARVWKE